MKTITLEHLKSLNACTNQLEIFKTTFGNEVEITKTNWELALSKNLNVIWLVYNVFTENQKEKYQQAIQPELEKYKKAIQPEQEKYQQAIQPEQEKYQQAIQPEWEKYQQAIQPEQEKYQNAIDWLIFDILTEED